MKNFCDDIDDYDIDLEKVVKSHKFTNLLIRYSDEIGTKSDKIQKEMEKELIRSINIQLGKRGIRLTKYHHEKGRLIVSLREEDFLKSALIIRNLTGISSISPVLKTDVNIDNIVKKTLEYIKPFYNSKIDFKINVKYAYKLINQNPIIITRRCLKELSEKFEDYKLEKQKASIFKIFIEIRKDYSYIFHLKIPGINPGLPIDLKSGIFINFLYRFHDLVVINRILRRGLQILPVIFLTERNQLFHKNQLLKNLIEPIYAVDNLFGILINIQDNIEQFFKLYNEEVCYYCRFFRMKLITIIKKEYKAFISKYFTTLIQENKINNLIFDKSHVNYIGIADADNEFSHCPTNEIFWKNDTLLQELILYPLISMSEKDIIRDLKDLYNANRRTNNSVNISSNLMSDIQNEVCGFKYKIGSIKRDRFLKVINSEEFSMLVKNSIDKAIIFQIF